mmetsp:Transcript_15415/g.62932  ORF Transcript_15415/g.62932 Transcript_15415/m.62932 type:complete len:169 (-) Transcript_15415:3186-3692(-)
MFGMGLGGVARSAIRGPTGRTFVRGYHNAKTERLKKIGFKGVLAGEFDYGKAQSDLERVTVMTETKVMPDGRGVDEVRKTVFGSVEMAGVAPKKTVRDGTSFLMRELKGKRLDAYYPKTHRGNPHTPFEQTPKQERWAAKMATLQAKNKKFFKFPKRGEVRFTKKRKG